MWTRAGESAVVEIADVWIQLFVAREQLPVLLVRIRVGVVLPALPVHLFEGLFFTRVNPGADPGEVTELIAPILDGGDFTGSQARLVPAGHPSLPAGSVLVQTADGSGLGEMLAITDPLGSPAYIPSGSAFFTGFDYNGGFDFGPGERVYVPEAEVKCNARRIFGLSNLLISYGVSKVAVSYCRFRVFYKS